MPVRMFLQVSFRLIVTLHVAVIFANVAAIFVIPFHVSWYVAFPLESFLIGLMFTAMPCPLTMLEDRVRRGLGKPEIKHFIGHYLVWPLRRRRRQQQQMSRSDNSVVQQATG